MQLLKNSMILQVTEFNVLILYKGMPAVVYYHPIHGAIAVATTECFGWGDSDRPVDQALVDWTHDFCMGYCCEVSYDIADRELGLIKGQYDFDFYR
jgi:hypothetical protein